MENNKKKLKPIEKLIDSVVKCVKCDAPYGKCNCWVFCKCGWFHEKDGSCNNPKCTEKL